MLRQVFVVKDGKILYKRPYGKALDEASFNHVLSVLSKGLWDVQGDKLDSFEYLKYRITYASIYQYRIIIILATGLADKPQNVKKELEKLKKEFLSNFEMILDDDVDEGTFEIFNSSVDSAHKNLRPKISLVGFSGVGKTTITRLIQANEIPIEHVPTITGDIATIKIGKLHFHLWDFAGQEQFSYLWDNFIKGSDAVLIISDSTLENVEKSKFFIELVKHQAPTAHVACIGNKQDLPDHMPVSDIERHLGVKTYSMVASNPGNRDKMITIIADILDMSAEVSPLLAPLLERDNKLILAEQSIENGDWETAIHLYEELSQLCITLGDDNVSKIFAERAAQIQGLLQKAQGAAPQPTADAAPAAPQVAPPPQPAGAATPAGPQIVPPPAPTGNVMPAGPQIVPPPASAGNVMPAAPQIVPPPQMPGAAMPAAPQIIPPLDLSKPMASEIRSPVKPVAEQQAPAVQQPPAPQPQVNTAVPGNVDALSAILSNIKASGSVSGAQAPAPAPVQSIPQQNHMGPSGIIDPRATAAQVTTHNSPTIPSSHAAGIQPAVQKPAEPQKTVVPPVAAAPKPIASQPIQTSPVDLAPKTSASNQPTQVKQQINNLKLKIINVDNTLFDLELKNISGDLSDDEFKEKEEKLKKMKQTLTDQIAKLENMLSEL